MRKVSTMFPRFYVYFCFFLITALLAFYFLRKAKVDTWDRYTLTFLSGVLGLFFYVMILDVGRSTLPTKWSEDYQSTKLVSMKDQNSLYGSFFLGSGQISGVQYYTYYYEYSGGFKRASLDPSNLAGSMSDVIIFEEDRKDGELKIFKRVYVEEWYQFFGFDLLSKRYEFHIPKGSITRGFELK